MLKTLFM